VNIYSCNMQDNRRQGVSLIHCSNIVVRDCTINGTYGHKPECGIDFEPNDAGKGINGVQILNNTITGNKGSGIQVGVPARLGSTCTILGVLIDGNTITGNGRSLDTTAGIRIESSGAANGVVATNNTVTGNTGRAGIGVDSTSGQRVQYNTVKNNTVSSGQIWERWGTNNILTPNTLV
jgi:parallel beta-helix repeat protein